MEDFNLSYPIQRRKTIEVKVGDVGIGGSNPVRVQSMTNTDTMDTEKTARQVMNLVDCGCEIVRITASEIDTARNLYNIKNFLVKHNYNVPLVADIHFNPKAAEQAAKIVEKVRINPGNYVDKKAKEVKTEEQYKEILEKAKENIFPLIDICKTHHTAIRIGVNHGSLSQRIINKYGNTPYAMAVSAMEFLKMFSEMDFNQIIVSMKASDTKVMNYSNRLLVDMMNKENMMFPIHIGVTEAGGGQDGRIKSISGICSLLSLGIGDTIRVSLTEKPENEIPVAKDIVRSYSYITDKEQQKPINSLMPKTLSLNSSYKKQYLEWQTKQGEKINLNKIKVDNVLSSCLNDKQPLTLTYDEKNKNLTKIIGDSATLLMEGVVKELDFKDKNLAMDILQAVGDKYYKAEFVACPSCGRTKYDIQSALEKVKESCSHLKGLKIAVMGCIVNGPGEITDADYGYIGCGGKKVNLYRQNKLIFNSIPEENAIDYLIKMIKEDGKWIEKK